MVKLGLANLVYFSGILSMIRVKNLIIHGWQTPLSLGKYDYVLNAIELFI